MSKELMTRPEPDYADKLEAQFRQDDDGGIQIGDDVIAHIASIAAAEIEGVVFSPKKRLTDIFQGRGEKEHVKGVEVDKDESGVSITLSVRMKYGTDMYDLGLRLRRHVKETIEKMTRVTVARVNVKIIGIVVEQASVKAGVETEEEAVD